VACRIAATSSATRRAWPTTCAPRLPGLLAPAVATALCAPAYLPVLVLVAAAGRSTPEALGYAVAAGVLASVVPYAADLVALRLVPARFFGVFMSVHPVLAALAGMVMLSQFLGLHEWIGIAVVVLTNAAAVATARGAEAGTTAWKGTSAGRPLTTAAVAASSA
jgi:inner membrane transporter RhtA